jgi:hypothetical protein
MPETRGDINLAVVGAGMGTDRRSVADTMRILHGRGRNFADVVDTIYRQIYLLAVTKHTYKSMNRPLPIRTSRSLGRPPLGEGTTPAHLGHYSESHFAPLSERKPSVLPIERPRVATGILPDYAE